MNKVIHKFPVNNYINQGGAPHLIPEGAKPICAHEQNGQICVWFEVDEFASLRNWYLWDIGTGIRFQDIGIPEDAIYVGTHLDVVGLVHHIYVKEI